MPVEKQAETTAMHPVPHSKPMATQPIRKSIIMKKSRIRELAQHVTEKTDRYMFGLSGGRSKSQLLAERMASALNDPGFCNRFVRAFVGTQEPLPPWVHESFLRRAYNHY